MSYRKSKCWEELPRDNFEEEGMWKFPSLEIVAERDGVSSWVKKVKRR